MYVAAMSTKIASPTSVGEYKIVRVRGCGEARANGTPPCAGDVVAVDLHEVPDVADDVLVAEVPLEHPVTGDQQPVVAAPSQSLSWKGDYFCPNVNKY